MLTFTGFKYKFQVYNKIKVPNKILKFQSDLDNNISNFCIFLQTELVFVGNNVI